MKKFNDFLEEKKVEEETGTAAVAGAGDDSSTVVVKKKKKIPMNTLGTLELKSESVELEEARVETSNKHDEFKKSILRDYPHAEFETKGTDTNAFVDMKKHGIGSTKVAVGQYDHKARRGFKYDKPNVKGKLTEASSALKKHSNWSQNDYNYLSGKGYTDKEIKTLWDRDAKSGKGPTQGNKNTMKYPDIEKGLKHQAIRNKMNEESPLQMAKNAIGQVVNKKAYQAAVSYMKKTGKSAHDAAKIYRGVDARTLQKHYETQTEGTEMKTFKDLTEAAYKPDTKAIEAAMRKALKDKGNYNKDGSVNWNYVDADVYMAHGPASHKDAKAHYRVFDSVASKLTKELGLKESTEEQLEEGMNSKSTASLQSTYNKYKDQQLNPSDAMKVRAIRRELMKRGVSLKEEAIEEAYTKQQLIKLRQILGRDGQLNRKVGVEKLMKHGNWAKETATAMWRAATVREDIDEGWENPLRAAREKKEREDAAKKSGSDKQEYSKRLKKKQYGSMMGGLKEDSIEEGIKPYVSGTDKWEVLNSKGKTVKSFPKTTAGMKDAQAYLDKNFAKLKEGAELDEAKSYVVMNKKTGKAVTKPMSMSMALDSYDSRGGNAKGLAVVSTDDKRLNESVELEEATYGFSPVIAKGKKAKDYMAKKAQQRRDMNTKNDPGAAKKHLALSVLDKEKARAKAKKKGANPSEFEYATGAKPNKMTLIQKGMDPSKARTGRRKLPEEVTWAIHTIEEAVNNQSKIDPETIKKIKAAFAKTAGMDDKALKIVSKKTGVDYETVKMVLDN